jgi:hypothetical protein
MEQGRLIGEKDDVKRVDGGGRINGWSRDD